MKPPYLPAGQNLQYVSADNPFMQAAKMVAEAESLDPAHPTGAVLVKGEQIIGAGANGSSFHKNIGCLRKILHVPTGKGYALCSGCSPKNHAEQKAIKAAKIHQEDPIGTDLYLWGHWWCCKSCWNAMIKAGIKNVYLPENAWEKFGR